MRYVLAYLYILISGVAVPFALQARDLIGRDYLIRAGEITALSLLEDFFRLSLLACLLFFVLHMLLLLLPFFRKRRRAQRGLTAFSLAVSGLSIASLALTSNTHLYGMTWVLGEGFMAFVVPVWPAILIVVMIGAYLGAQLDKRSGGGSMQVAS